MEKTTYNVSDDIYSRLMDFGGISKVSDVLINKNGTYDELDTAKKIVADIITQPILASPNVKLDELKAKLIACKDDLKSYTEQLKKAKSKIIGGDKSEFFKLGGRGWHLNKLISSKKNEIDEINTEIKKLK